MRAFIVVAVVTLSGFIALSYEILWYRACSFASGASPATFGVLLAAYLAGIALGALQVRRLCRDRDATGDRRHLLLLAGFLACANLVGFLVVPALSYLCLVVSWHAALLLVMVAAGLLGAVLPLVSHFAIPPDDRAGARLSYLYVGNIGGSAAGSLLTGFWLMDILPFEGIAFLLLVLGLLLSAALVLCAGLASTQRWAAAAVTVVAMVLGWLALPALHDGMYERLLFKGEYERGTRFVQVVENRHGVVCLTEEGLVYGGGTCDGGTSTTLGDRSWWILRPYALAAFHEGPKTALTIGLGGGAWAQIVANMPGLERLTAVEINPGYLEVIRRRPQVASLIEDPRVRIELDDGRRWLNRHPESRFDVIVQNTTLHWRAHATHVLSREYMELCRTRLNPGGIMIVNPTGSDDVVRTLLDVFPHAVRVYNCILVSDTPLVFDRDRWRRTLESWRIDDQPVLDLDTAEGRRILEDLLTLGDSLQQPPSEQIERLESRGGLLSRLDHAGVITDDNMLNEWRWCRWLRP